jgi:hypothetical protein
VAVINPRIDDVSLATLVDPPSPAQALPNRSHSALSLAEMLTSLSSLLCHVLPSPPPGPPPLETSGGYSHPAGFELRVIPQSISVDVAKEDLSNALVATVGEFKAGSLGISIRSPFATVFQLQEQDLQTYRNKFGGFLLTFINR